MDLPRWGIVSTIKAPVAEILDFCAHHLDLGAHRIFVYLDDDNRAAFDRLSAHPKIRPTLTNDAYWRQLGFKRRAKHQSRQFENARHAYGRAGDVDWLTHIDVDELLWPARPLADQLADLPPDCLCARIRPVEALAPCGPSDVTHFKACAAAQPKRKTQTAQLYPTFGLHLNGGFLSHVAGKMIYRTGVPDLKVQIHNVFVGDQMNPGQQELPQTELLHLHAKSWEAFRAAFHYRLEKGSYRSELKPNKPRDEGGLSMHELFSSLYADKGDAGLRAFYDEVCTASPALQERLAAVGLLRSYALDLTTKTARHF
ncbi:glycosyltransferase family 2 protein [Thalassovita taeanensis]|uniref:Glycosyl transferase family 2 n=1 Tax=Thalassovita taeanensis TaxID=657014 RepID=A0A1H9FQJ5_9RHOB|nr:glycosyltransferase family 2 protein [Thalassovita taeanensis]SEQ40240.1 Glycosyl transferase family 2 [Thalassovita taeanensis]